MSIKELTKTIGRDRRTIKRALELMSKIIDRKTGEIISMVTKDEDDETYKALPVGLDLAAKIAGTAGVTEAQKKLHERERRLHALAWSRGRRSGDKKGVAQNSLGVTEREKILLPKDTPGPARRFRIYWDRPICRSIGNTWPIRYRKKRARKKRMNRRMKYSILKHRSNNQIILFEILFGHIF